MQKILHRKQNVNLTLSHESVAVEASQLAQGLLCILHMHAHQRDQLMLHTPTRVIVVELESSIVEQLNDGLLKPFRISIQQ